MKETNAMERTFEYRFLERFPSSYELFPANCGWYVICKNAHLCTLKKKMENEFSNYLRCLPKKNFSGFWINWWKIKLPHILGNWHQGMWKFTHWIQTTIWACLVNEIEEEFWFNELNLWSVSSICTVVLNNGPPKVSYLNPWNLWILTFHGKRVFANVIKIRILKWGDYPGLSWGALNISTVSL